MALHKSPRLRMSTERHAWSRGPSPSGFWSLEKHQSWGKTCKHRHRVMTYDILWYLIIWLAFEDNLKSPAGYGMKRWKKVAGFIKKNERWPAIPSCCQIGLDESVPNLETRNHVVLPAFVWAKFQQFWWSPKSNPKKLQNFRLDPTKIENDSSILLGVWAISSHLSRCVSKMCSTAGLHQLEPQVKNWA